jgi:transposase-like protein
MENSVNLCALIEQFGSEEKCREYLEALRWPDRVTCPRCAEAKASRITKRNQFDCDACRYQFSVTAGTIFNDSHLPLWKWFLATYLLCESRKGMSANQIKRTLGISYKTAWYLCHRIREAMKETGAEPLEGPIVEMDETYVGGKFRGADARRNRLKNKEIVIGIRARGGDVRFFHAQDVQSSTLAKYIKDNVSPEARMICTDELTSYPGAVKQSGLNIEHRTVNHAAKEYVYGDVTTNGIESSFACFKRGLVGSYHRLSVKHLNRYLNEFQFKANNRKNPELFEDVLKGIASNPRLPFRVLVDGPAGEQEVPF